MTAAQQGEWAYWDVNRYSLVYITGAVLTLGSQPGAPEFTPEELRAAVEEANKAGLRVAAHAHGPEGAMNAIRAGADLLVVARPILGATDRRAAAERRC